MPLADTVSSQSDPLSDGKAHQLGGRLREAGECFAMAIDDAAGTQEWARMAEGLRRLGIVHHLQGETTAGKHYCDRSRSLSEQMGLKLLAAEATMALANIASECGQLAAARQQYGEALRLADGNAEFAARIEQNLGILESVQGNLAAALVHYRRALQAFETTQNKRGCARAHHNIGMICADQREWNAAQNAYDQAIKLARLAGDRHLEGLCLLNQAEVELAHNRYVEMHRNAEAALAIFDEEGARADSADAFRMLGTALRHLNRPTLAESRLRAAIDIAATASIPLVEAESCRDIAYLLADTGRSEQAVPFIDRALTLFKVLGATRDIAEVSQRRVTLLAA